MRPMPRLLLNEPNTGPDKVPGVFTNGDIVLYAGRWSARYFYIGPGIDERHAQVLKDCGCPNALQQAPLDQLIHHWHYEHGDQYSGGHAADQSGPAVRPGPT